MGSGGGVHAAPRLRADAPRNSIVALESGFARPGLSEYTSANRVRGGRGVQSGRSQSAAGSPGRAELKRRGSGGPTLASAAGGVGVGSGPRESLKRHPERPGTVSRGKVRLASCAWGPGEFVATSECAGVSAGTAGCHGHGGGALLRARARGAPARNSGGRPEWGVCGGGPAFCDRVFPPGT